MRYTPVPLNTGHSAIEAINQNLNSIKMAIDDSLSRKGDSPNDMNVDLDMNDNDILNVNQIDVQALTVQGFQFVPDEALVTDLPSPIGHSGKVLKSNGTNASWQIGDDTMVLYKDTIASLSATTGMANGAVYKTKGRDSVGDGGHGTYRYDSSSTATVNGATVFNGPGGVGRLLLLDDGSVLAEQAGAKGDGVTDDSAALQAVLTAGKILVLSKGKTYKYATGLLLTHGQKIISHPTTTLDYTGTGYGIDAAVDPNWISGCYFERVVVKCSTAGSVAWRYRFKYSTAIECYALLNASTQIGWVLETDYVNGSGPYYNVFINCNALGKVGIIGGVTNQTGWDFLQNIAYPTRGPNANTWIGGRTSAVSNAWKISGSKNSIYGTTCEGTDVTVFTINGLAGGAGCNNNVIHAPYVEGYNTGTGVDVFSIGSNATGTYICQPFVTSIGTGTLFSDSGTGTKYEPQEGYRLPNVGSTDSRTLDYYLEGTWTPAIAGSTTAGTQTYSTQVGTYTRIGNICYIQGSIVMTAKDAATAGYLRITGLPFTSKNTSGFYGSMAIGAHKFDLDANYYQVGLLVDPNNTIASIMESGDNTAPTNMAAANLLATTQIHFSGFYLLN